MKKKEIKFRKQGILLSTISFLGILFLILTLNPINAQAGSYYCAEKTTGEAWCMNVPEEEVNKNYNYAPTSCESTSFCKAGTCVNAIEGECRPNVPKIVCVNAKGVWREEGIEELSQCQLGCCYIGNEASFVTQTKCASQSSRNGVEMKFDSSIRDSNKCFASAYPEERGACVTDDGFLRKCKMKTSAECDSEKASAREGTDVIFSPGDLCTNSGLETTCIPTEKTMLEEGIIYFIDSCENRANIYNFNRKDDPTYWDKIIEKKDSCVLTKENIDSCGNCDYGNWAFASIGKKYDSKDRVMFPIEPKIGDYVCANLGCQSGQFATDFEKEFGRYPKHGESWCGTTTSVKSSIVKRVAEYFCSYFGGCREGFTRSEENLPGSEQFKYICDFGEVDIQQGKPYRGDICLEEVTTIEGADEFVVANFRKNMWETCTIQDNKEDCEDIQKRDCVWMEGEGTTLWTLYHDEEGIPLAVNKDGELVPKNEITLEDPGTEVITWYDTDAMGGYYRHPNGTYMLRSKEVNYGLVGGACVPKYPPALWFWEAEKDNKKEETDQKSAGDICSVGTEICIVKFTKGKLFDTTWDCNENCHCLGLKKGVNTFSNEDPLSKAVKLDESNEWLMGNLEVCNMIGDCGVKVNYLGKEGRWKLEDLLEYTILEEEE